MELITNTACLLCKQQTTVLKLDNVKTYLDKLWDTFFDRSNISKDKGMVANASLCLMCTAKVYICCNLRNDYDDKYNGKCLQKLLSAACCLLCDGNLTPLIKTQDMPSSLLQQIELFMNSTSFPESHSNSALCLTCIHSLNIWHEVRSSIMKLRQNDEVDERSGANERTDFDSNYKLSIRQLEIDNLSDNENQLNSIQKSLSKISNNKIIKNGKKQKPKFSLKLKTQEHEKSKTKKQITESEGASDTGSTENSEHQKRSTRLEAQMAIIHDSSDNESDHSPSLEKNRKVRESKTRNNRKSENGKDKIKLVDDFSGSESAGTKITLKSKDSKKSSKADNGKSDSDWELETTVNDSSDSESTSNLADNNQSCCSKTRTSHQKNRKRSRRLRISFETKKNRGEASRTSDSSDEFESKSARRKRSLRKLPSFPKIVFSDSSEKENIHTLSSKSRTRSFLTKTKEFQDEASRTPDSSDEFESKSSRRKRSLRKLPSLPKIVFSDSSDEENIHTVSSKSRTRSDLTKTKEFPKLKLQKSEPLDKENDRSIEETDKSSITIISSDDESRSTMNSFFIEIQTLRCRICDKISKTFYECKAHGLFHRKPQKMVIIVVRENLKQLQEKYRSASNNSDNVIAKYIDIGERSVGELQETISNEHSSGNGSVNVDDEELQLVEDSTSKSHVSLPNEKSLSTSEDNSDCENFPNVVNEKKRKLSILLNNSRDKFDNSSPNPKRVRSALDHKSSSQTQQPNSQLTEDLTKTKLKYSRIRL